MEPINITPEQRRLLSALQAGKENFIYEWDEIRGVLSFVRSDSIAKNTDASSRTTISQQTLSDFIKVYGSLFGSPTLRDGLKLIIDKEDQLGWRHYQFQSYQAVGKGDQKGETEFYGSKLAAHFKPDGTMVEVQSSCYRDIDTSNSVKVTTPDLQRKLLAEISQMEGFRRLEEQMKKRKEELFPLMQEPRLVIYPWKGKMLQAWATYGYAPYTHQDELRQPDKNPKPSITFGQMFFNAETAELFLFAPTQKGVETATTGSGLGCTPLGGPYVSRSLDIVRVDSTSTYLLKNKTKARDIVTYDANANSSWGSSVLCPLLDAGTVPVSSDTDGDKNWSNVAADATDAQRTASQQPEVDEHFTVAQLYDWYSAIGGRVGWDDNDFTAPLVPNQTFNIVAHCYDDGFAGTSRSVNANFDQQLVSGHWLSRLAFFDGDPTGTTLPGIAEDYLAGSQAIVGHEYQHGVTDFSFKDGSGNPGLTYSDWFAAIHEGTSDVFGGLFSGDWWMATSISPTGQIFRNLAFPRDTTALDPSKFDHWDDRNNMTGTAARYFRGDILAHCAYLMAQGGVHQRSSRTPVLIPVKGLGRETAGGLSVYKAARIWYRGLSLYLSNIGAMTGIPTNDETIYRSFRNATVSAAIDLYGTNSLEHKTTILAWYAVGLQPVGTDYGADVTFLTWGADWWMSRPYIGISSPDWSSVDLFINNGGTSEWNASVNVLDGGTPTQFENQVYCRVRNVGTQTSNNVQVQFEYAKITTSAVTWFPITDKDGNIQVLNVGNLTAGNSNFPDSAQNTPPATAMIKWWIPPIESGETVDHYCIKATVFSINEGNPVNNEVQSNIAYVPYTPGSGLRMGFFANNPFRHPVPVELKLTHTLPKDWKVRVLEPVSGMTLKPGEGKRAHVVIEMPGKTDTNLEAPFDGQVKGRITDGGYDWPYMGVLSRAKLSGSDFRALMSINAGNGKPITGNFEGTLNVATGKFNGTLNKVPIEGCLRPQRVVNIGQYVHGEPIGGLSMQVQVPLPQGSCFEKLPPTDVYVPTRKGTSGGKDCIEGAEEILRCLDIQKQNVCAVKLKSIIVEIKFKDEVC